MINEFINKFHASFNANELFKIVFDMSGGAKDEYIRAENVLKRFKYISEEIFIETDIWVALILWDNNIENDKNLKAWGFDINYVNSVYIGHEDDNIFAKTNFESFANSPILYLYYNKFEFIQLSPLVKAIANFELAIGPSANITCYFLNFDSDREVLLNLYDDRGLELLTPNNNFYKKLLEKFKVYVL